MSAQMSPFNKAFLDHPLACQLSCFLHQLKLPSKNTHLVLAGTSQGSVGNSQLVSFIYSLLSGSGLSLLPRHALACHSLRMTSIHRPVTGPSASEGRMTLAEGEPRKLLESPKTYKALNAEMG